MSNLSKYVGPSQGSPYALSTLSARIELPNLLKELEVANRQISFSVTGKLKLIQDQIDYLQMEAIKIVEQAKRDMDLHKIPCSLEKRVGSTYHLYQRMDGSRFFSILSPEDWGNMIPGSFQSSWRLESDMTWFELV